MRILLVRHGQTQWNTGEERFRGRSEVDLDELGARQAEAVARRIAQWQVGAVYSSPQKRALRTAESIARRLELVVQPLEGLADMDFGEWEGLSLSEARSRDSKLFQLWVESPHRVTFPRGENLEQVRGRLTSTLEVLLTRHPEETIVLVSHRVICKALLLISLGMDSSCFWKVGQDTCALNIIEMRDTANPRVIVLNDICHLQDLK